MGKVGHFLVCQNIPTFFLYALKALQAGHFPLAAMKPDTVRKGIAYEKNTQNIQENTKTKKCHVEQKRSGKFFLSEFCRAERQAIPK
ncbi:MAG: hypothetical protein ACOH2R_24245 [Pseudomonas sp.]